MTQHHFAPDLEELREDARRLEEELRELQARIDEVAPRAQAEPIAEPWNVAPYSWAICAYRRAQSVQKRLQAHGVWHRIRERLATWKLARHNSRERLAWRDTSHDEIELRLVN